MMRGDNDDEMFWRNYWHMEGTRLYFQPAQLSENFIISDTQQAGFELVKNLTFVISCIRLCRSNSFYTKAPADVYEKGYEKRLLFNLHSKLLIHQVLLTARLH